LFLIQALGDGSKARGVREKDGYRAAFAFQGSAVAEDLLSQVARRIGKGVSRRGWPRGFR
jgi:hypothetical protein